MSVGINALLVFCEGVHDVAYVRMVFSKILGFSKVELPFQELPSPFHIMFKKAVENHAAKDLSLDMAHKFFLPDSILRKENNLVALFNSGGKTQYNKISTLLSNYLPISSKSNTFAQGASEVVSSTKYVFLYDADAEGLEIIIKNINKEFSRIGETDFITEEWKESLKSKFGKTSGDKAVFVWGESPEKGTLEDILTPLFLRDQPDLMQKSTATIEDMFLWDTDNSKKSISIPEIERKKKSILTVIGQRKKPGSSMNVILEQAGLLKDDTLKQDVRTNDFVDFIVEFAVL